MGTEVNGRRLSDAEIVSVLRNWTGGDLGSIAQCVGVLVHHLAAHPQLQDRLRADVADAELDAVLDEILRIDDPFVSNRRVTTCPLTIAGVALPAAARVKLNWTSANRDEAVFGDPNALDPRANAERNLVYGIGRHACPGRAARNARDAHRRARTARRDDLDRPRPAAAGRARGLARRRLGQGARRADVSVVQSSETTLWAEWPCIRPCDISGAKPPTCDPFHLRSQPFL